MRKLADIPASFSNLLHEQHGAAMTEFALVLPLLLGLLVGMVALGQYFLLAHSAQELANDGARATIAGLNASERNAIATSRIAADAAQLDAVRGDKISSSESETADVVTVTVTIDASDVPLLFNTFLPMPNTKIVRRAVIAPGGFQ